MSLCSQAQVEQRLQIDFTNDPEAVITELIAAATGHIERIVGRVIEADDYTETFDAPDTPNVWLLNTPINTLTSVTVDGDALSTDQFSHDPESGRVTRVTNGRPRSWNVHKVQSVVVAYNGGYQTVPYDIQDICARMVARAFQAGASYASVPAGADGVKQINLAGSDSVTFAGTTTDVTVAEFLAPDEVDALKYYRHVFV